MFHSIRQYQFPTKNENRRERLQYFFAYFVASKPDSVLRFTLFHGLFDFQHFDEFVYRLMKTHPKDVLVAAKLQRLEHKNPPKTVAEHLATLEQHIP